MADLVSRRSARFFVIFCSTGHITRDDTPSEGVLSMYSQAQLPRSQFLNMMLYESIWRHDQLDCGLLRDSPQPFGRRDCVRGPCGTGTACFRTSTCRPAAGEALEVGQVKPS